MRPSATKAAKVKVSKTNTPAEFGRYVAVVKKKATKIKHREHMFDSIAVWFVDARIAIDADIHDLVPIEIEAIHLALVTNELHT